MTIKIPAPVSGEKDYEYYPIMRIGRVIPFGYYQDPDDPDMLVPIPEELELLEQAKVHLKRYSLRAVADWLSEQSGRSISHTGLSKRLQIEQKRNREYAVTRQLAKRYKAAMEKAEKIESNFLGKKGPRKTET